MSSQVETELAPKFETTASISVSFTAGVTVTDSLPSTCLPSKIVSSSKVREKIVREKIGCLIFNFGSKIECYLNQNLWESDVDLEKFQTALTSLEHLDSPMVFHIFQQFLLL